MEGSYSYFDSLWLTLPQPNKFDPIHVSKNAPLPLIASWPGWGFSLTPLIGKQKTMCCYPIDIQVKTANHEVAEGWVEVSDYTYFGGNNNEYGGIKKILDKKTILM